MVNIVKAIFKMNGLCRLFFFLSKEAENLGRKTLQSSLRTNPPDGNLCNSARKFFGIRIREQSVASVNFTLWFLEIQS